MIKTIEQYCFLQDISKSKNHNNQQYNEEEMILDKFDALSSFSAIFKIILTSLLIGLPLAIYSKVFVSESSNGFLFALITFSLFFLIVQNLFITKKYMFYRHVEHKLFHIPLFFIQLTSASFFILTYIYMDANFNSSYGLIVFLIMYILVLPFISIFVFSKFCLVCKGETKVLLIILPLALMVFSAYIYEIVNTSPMAVLVYSTISITASLAYTMMSLLYGKYLCLTEPFINDEEFKNLIIKGRDKRLGDKTYGDLRNINPLS